MLDAGLNGLVKDVDGNFYKTIKIGKQVWMAENLKTTRYNNTTAIPLVTDNYTWINLTSSGYCWYRNDSATYARPYGALYNWYTVATGNLCPTGWHIPTSVEWASLNDYLGGLSIAGGLLKETGTKYWISPNTGATNETGFTARPGGFRGFSNSFTGAGHYAYWTSATEELSGLVTYEVLTYNLNEAKMGPALKVIGLSVRCLRD